MGGGRLDAPLPPADHGSFGVPARRGLSRCLASCRPFRSCIDLLRRYLSCLPSCLAVFGSSGVPGLSTSCLALSAHTMELSSLPLLCLG